jgi:hypothetical protein
MLHYTYTVYRVVLKLFITHTLPFSRYNYNMRATISLKKCETYSQSIFLITRFLRSYWVTGGQMWPLVYYSVPWTKENENDHGTYTTRHESGGSAIYILGYFINQLKNHVLLEYPEWVITSYLIQIWNVDGWHVKTCSIEPRPFTEFLYYLHHHPTNTNWDFTWVKYSPNRLLQFR